jgi:hypothetical protein
MQHAISSDSGLIFSHVAPVQPILRLNFKKYFGLYSRILGSAPDRHSCDVEIAWCLQYCRGVVVPIIVVTQTIRIMSVRNLVDTVRIEVDNTNCWWVGLRSQVQVHRWKL